MKLLLIGLGNIGADYVYTRHNMGFLVIDHLAMKKKVDFQTNKLAFMTSFTYAQHQVYMIKPTTYMNNSGQAVKYWLNALHIPLTHSLTIVDDYTLPFGKIRLRYKGSHGGHKGLKSIADSLLATDYPRLRIGIGRAFPKGGLADFVLGNFTLQEQEQLTHHVDQAAQVVATWYHASMTVAMNPFNN